MCACHEAFAVAAEEISTPEWRLPDMPNSGMSLEYTCTAKCAACACGAPRKVVPSGVAGWHTWRDGICLVLYSLLASTHRKPCPQRSRDRGAACTIMLQLTTPRRL